MFKTCSSTRDQHLRPIAPTPTQNHLTTHHPLPKRTSARPHCVTTPPRTHLPRLTPDTDGRESRGNTQYKLARVMISTRCTDAQAGAVAPPQREDSRGHSRSRHLSATRGKVTFRFRTHRRFSLICGFIGSLFVETFCLKVSTFRPCVFPQSESWRPVQLGGVASRAGASTRIVWCEVLHAAHDRLIYRILRLDTAIILHHLWALCERRVHDGATHLRSL